MCRVELTPSHFYAQGILLDDWHRQATSLKISDKICQSHFIVFVLSCPSITLSLLLAVLHEPPAARMTHPAGPEAGERVAGTGDSERVAGSGDSRARTGGQGRRGREAQRAVDRHVTCDGN